MTPTIFVFWGTNPLLFRPALPLLSQLCFNVFASSSIFTWDSSPDKMLARMLMHCRTLATFSVTFGRSEEKSSWTWEKMTAAC